MVDTPTTGVGVAEETYHTLGNKTLMIFALERVPASLWLLFLSIVLFVVQGQSFIAAIPVQGLAHYVMIAALTCLLLFVLFFGLAFFIAWLTYVNYKFLLGADSLKITRGILDKEEIAIPYRQIQDVDIDRNLSFRMIGASRIIILTAGHEDDPKEGGSEGVLPVLDRELAEWLQAELLKRANVQKVIETK